MFSIKSLGPLISSPFVLILSIEHEMVGLSKTYGSQDSWFIKTFVSSIISSNYYSIIGL